MSLTDETKKWEFVPSMNIRERDHAEIERKTAEFLAKKKKILEVPVGASAYDELTLKT